MSFRRERPRTDLACESRYEPYPLGTVVSHGNGFRMQIPMMFAQSEFWPTRGPTRETKVETREDLVRARECGSRYDMVLFVRALKDPDVREWHRMELLMDDMYTRWNRLAMEDDVSLRMIKRPVFDGVLPESGLLLHRKWLDLILSGRKTWEIRGQTTTKRGVVALILCGSKHVFGEVEIADSRAVSRMELLHNADKHCISDLSIINYSLTYAWILRDAKRYKDPRPYRHPRGGGSWVDLSE